MVVYITPATEEGDAVVVDSEKNAFQGLVDTGATASCISPKVADTLEIKPKGKITVQTAGGAMKSNQYRVNMHIPVEVTKGTTGEISLRNFVNIEVSEFQMQSKYDVILGMDVIMQGSLHVANNHFTFCT